MEGPLNPPPHQGPRLNALPAYVSNGVIGLRIREIPLTAGITLVSGYTGEHPIRMIESAASAPYPLAGDIQISNVWMSDALHQSTPIDQSYDFTCGELTTRFKFIAGNIEAYVTVLTFCSRDLPSLVCQETSVKVSGAGPLGLKAVVDARHIDGRALRHSRTTPGEPEAACDGALLWEGAGGLSTCGLAYSTELLGIGAVKPDRPALIDHTLSSHYMIRARADQHYRLRQMVSVVPSATHSQPDFEAVRQVALARKKGFDSVRAANRAKWVDLWKGRIRLVGAPKRWQAMSDAAFFYLMSSTHVASPASTSIFGLATWHDYHYYYGHVMWDIETFIVPVLSILQSDAAESILDYRSRNLLSAASNARLRGRRGLQFPWESAPSSGQEAAPMPGSASWHEDHVSLDVAKAFVFHADATGDLEFLRTKAWPVLSGVARWITSRVTKTRRGYEIRSAMGIAERETEVANAAFTNMSAASVLRSAMRAADQLGLSAESEWVKIANELVIPMRGSVIVSHDDYRTDEEKGGTPDPLMGVFPLDYEMPPKVEAATLKFYLGLRKKYIGSPMLSALYGVWAAYTGDRVLSARLMEDGYGRFCVDRFCQTLEYREDVFPEQPRGGPFFANLGGFLMGLLLGFPGLRPGSRNPSEWAQRDIVLPQGWSSIEVGQLWIHRRPFRLVARQGKRAVLTAM
jgi:trehalose/maltose hydrolase-like predicted phosphorylase